MNKKTTNLMNLADELNSIEERLSVLRDQTVFSIEPENEQATQEIGRLCALLARSALELGIATYAPLRLIASEKKLRESK